MTTETVSRLASRLLLLGVALIALWLGWRCWKDPRISFLGWTGSGTWIVYPNPPDLLVHPISSSNEPPRALFRRAFGLPAPSSAAKLEFRAMRECQLFLNGQPLAAPAQPPGSWKDSVQIDIPAARLAGSNQLEVLVQNASGPPAFWLRFQAGDFTLTTDEQWQVSLANAVWQSAVPARAPKVIRAGNHLHSSQGLAAVLRQRSGTIAALLLLGTALGWMARRWMHEPGPEADQTRLAWSAVGGLLLLWVVLFLNNANQLSPANGFDLQHHLSYIKHVQDYNALPAGDAGWETHQPPFYYVLAAWLLKLCSLPAFSAEGLTALRALSLLFGLGQIVLVFAGLRQLFPNEWRRPLLGTTFAAFLPLQLYHAHYVTNETCLAVLVSGVFFLTLKWLRARRSQPWLAAALGLCLGMALLTKVSAVVVAPLVFGTMIARLLALRAPAEKWFTQLGLALLACVAVCGGYYWRSLAEFGNPLSDNSRWGYGLAWWQDEGYRTPGYYLRFGQALVEPMFSGFHSFWDGLYSTFWGDGLAGGSISTSFAPPWNYDLLSLGYLLALLPTAALLVGLGLGLRGLRREPTLERVLLLGTLLLFSLAVLYISLLNPGASQVRASFALLTLLPLSAVFAVGFDRLRQQHPALGLVLVLALGCWAVNSYFAHWIQRDSAQVQLLRANLLFKSGNIPLATQLAEAGLRQNPAKSALRGLLADGWNQLGRTNDSQALVSEALRRFPQDPLAHLDASFDLMLAGRLAEAEQAVRRALQLAPDHAMGARQLVMLLWKQEKRNEALESCRQALRVAPYDPELQFWLRELAAGKAFPVPPRP